MLYMKVINVLSENQLKPRLWVRYRDFLMLKKLVQLVTTVFQKTTVLFVQITEVPAVLVLYLLVYLQKQTKFCV